MSSPDYSDFDADALLSSLYGMDAVGVGGMTMTDPNDHLFAPSTSSGVGVVSSAPLLATPTPPPPSPPTPSPPPPPPPPPPPTTHLSAVGVGSVTSRTVSTASNRPTVAGKRPRQHPVTAGKRLPSIVNPHRRVGGPPRRRRRRSLLSTSTSSRGNGGGGGGSSDDGDDSDVSSSSSSSNPGGRHRMSQEELRRQLELLSNDQVQTASGRRIAGITTTNTITTTYKDGGRPRVARHSSRVSH